MFLQRFSALKDDLNKRTLAAFYLATSIEIASRRDTSILEDDVYTLNSLTMIYRGIEEAWSTLYSELDPIAVVHSFDSNFANLSGIEKFFMNRFTARNAHLFINDLIYTLTHDELMTEARSAIFANCMESIESRSAKISL